MTLRHYVAIVEAADRGYGVFFPNLPGCTSGVDSGEAAILNAKEAAGAWVEVTAEHGEPIPDSTPTARINVDTDVHEAARILVPVEAPDDGGVHNDSDALTPTLSHP